MYYTNYIRVIGDGEKASAGKLFFFNDNDLRAVADAVSTAKAHHARVGSKRGRIASFRPTGDPAIDVIGERSSHEPPGLKSEAADRDLD